MILKHYSYFNTAGRYRGTMNLFEPEASKGETLHDDGVSIIHVDGVMLQEIYPEAKWGSEGLTQVDGEFTADYKLVDGVPQFSPVVRPPLPLDAEELYDMLVAKGTVRDTDRPRPKAARRTA